MANVSTAEAQSMELAFESLDLVKLWQTPDRIFFPMKYRKALIYFLNCTGNFELIVSA